MVKKGLVLIITVLVIFLLALAVSCDDKSNNYDDGYSQQYKTDSQYRKNVDDVAGVYGKNPKDVDRAIHAITGD